MRHRSSLANTMAPQISSSLVVNATRIYRKRRALLWRDVSGLVVRINERLNRPNAVPLIAFVSGAGPLRTQQFLE